MAIAALLSLPRLGVRAVWLDEAYTVGATTELLDTWRETAGNQALYYLLVWPIARVSTDAAWIRLPAALLGLAAVAVVFLVGRRLGGVTRGAVAAGGLALSWGLARFSVEARSYTMALLLVATTWLALIAAVQAGDEEAGTDRAADGDDTEGDPADDAAEGESAASANGTTNGHVARPAAAAAAGTAPAARRWWRLYHVATALVPLAHGLSALNYVVQLAALGLAPAGDRRPLLRRALVIAPVLAVEFAVMFLLGAGDVGDWVAPLRPGQLLAFGHVLLGSGVTGVVLGTLTTLAIVEVVRSYWADRTRAAWLEVLPVFWALGPSVIVVTMSLIRPYAAARYVFPSIAAFHLLMAGLLVRHLRSIRHLTAVAVLVAPLLLLDQRHVTTYGAEGWPELLDCIAANAEPGDRLATDANHRSAIDYHWPDHPGLDEVEPLTPPEPLGEVRRLYENPTEDLDEFIALLREDTDGSIWYVDRTPLGRLVVLGMAFDANLARDYRLIEPWYFKGDLTLTRLDPVDSTRPRGTACDVVPTPSDMRPPSADD
ncbi:MAG TPA: hypothetical protein VIL36_21945 [Acidimicrobiales bacterium]